MEEIKREPVTALLILLNTLIFLIVEFTGGSENGQHMLECGAVYAPLIIEQGQWYRMITSMFLHFGAPHLINNMLVLFVLGQRLEPVTGKMKFLLIYILGGLGGNLISLIWDMRTGNYSLSAGASGAIFGLIGALAAVLLFCKEQRKRFDGFGIFLMIAGSLYHGFESGTTDNAAHIGGCIAGFILSMLLYVSGNLISAHRQGK